MRLSVLLQKRINDRRYQVFDTLLSAMCKMRRDVKGLGWINNVAAYIKHPLHYMRESESWRLLDKKFNSFPIHTVSVSSSRREVLYIYLNEEGMFP
jgi:hypothetical protein